MTCDVTARLAFQRCLTLRNKSKIFLENYDIINRNGGCHYACFTLVTHTQVQTQRNVTTSNASIKIKPQKLSKKIDILAFVSASKLAFLNLRIMVATAHAYNSCVCVCVTSVKQA